MGKTLNLEELRALINEHLPHMRWALGLERWRIDTEYVPEIDERLGARAEILPNYSYLRAKITFAYGQAQSADEWLNTLRHELIHLLITPICEVFNQTDQALDDHPVTRRVLNESYHHANELTVCGIERMFDGIGLDAKGLLRISRTRTARHMKESGYIPKPENKPAAKKCDKAKK